MKIIATLQLIAILANAAAKDSFYDQVVNVSRWNPFLFFNATSVKLNTNISFDCPTRLRPKCVIHVNTALPLQRMPRLSAIHVAVALPMLMPRP